MSNVSRYNNKDIFAAVLAVQEILDLEHFEIEIRTATCKDAEWIYDDSVEGQKVFAIKDLQGGDWSNVNRDVLFNLGQVIERLQIPHDDYFYAAYNNRKAAGEDIPRDDWDRKVLVFLESEFCQDLLIDIDVEAYQKFKDTPLNEIGLNSGEVEKYVENDRFDAVGYLCDKTIALKIMDTQSAYPIVEYNNSIYVAAHGDWYENHQEMLKDLSAGENSFCNNYSNYGTLFETELYQVKDDMHDLGIVNEFGNWEFYLSKYELEYIGLGDELAKFKKDFDSIIANAKNRADKNNIVVGNYMSFENDMEIK